MHLKAPWVVLEKMDPGRKSASALLKVTEARPLFKWHCQLQQSPQEQLHHRSHLAQLLFFSLYFSAEGCTAPLLFCRCWKESRNWWPYESPKNRANHCGKSHTSTLSMAAGYFLHISFFPVVLLSIMLSVRQAFGGPRELPTFQWSFACAANELTPINGCLWFANEADQSTADVDALVFVWRKKKKLMERGQGRFRRA